MNSCRVTMKRGEDYGIRNGAYLRRSSSPPPPPPAPFAFFFIQANQSPCGCRTKWQKDSRVIALSRVSAYVVFKSLRTVRKWCVSVSD